MNFIVMDKILLSIFLANNIPEIFFIKGTNNDWSIIWNQDPLTMWARITNNMHALLFLLMHFIVNGPPRGEYTSYFIRNTEHFDRTFY
jgi:hypothetical protein